ncbi:hypothetical protein L3X38_010430 [Prunus dulcis]|uniref:Reverse transcriptase Ty1/copia-type domain-containing protein n=1 Tax=Prunus dulcis TaxID=3755 RepID=A0AAD4WFL2_PRUDU|nr:hypothetical protein L3X38_010430 [Prunus dulcis]
MPIGVLVNVASMGSLVIDTTRGRKYIREVMYLLGLMENLLSVGQMDEHGYFLVFGEGMCKVFDDSSMNCLIIKESTIFSRPSQHIPSDISSEERNTQAYDHSPLKWRRLDDVLAQCNLCIIEPKKYAEAAQDTFLNGVLQEEIYIDQPEGFVVKGKEDKVYRLHKALYGLKQAPRAWYGEIDTYFMQCGFEKSLSESTLYTNTIGDRDILIVYTYVDEIVYTGSSKELLEEFKEDMEMKY